MALDLRNSTVNSQTSSRADIDAGQRSYMLRVYNYMSLGVAFTGIIVLLMAANPNLMISLATGMAKWVLFAAVIGMGFLSGKIMTMKSTMAAQAFFWIYAALWGVMISPMVAYFLQTTSGTMDVARAFFITAGMFAGSSIFGYVTKKDLSALGRFFVMASIGLLIAMFVNVFFIKSTGFSMITSVVAVLLFAAMTAWETQKIKSMYYQAAGDAHVIGRMAIFGAFQLYGSFVIMFIHILNIIGIMRSD